jgi:flagellar hook assembly protein FlgD
MLGEEVATLVRGEQTVGSYEVMWNGKNNRGETAATGIYLYKMRAGEFLTVKKMMLMK